MEFGKRCSHEHKGPSLQWRYCKDAMQQAAFFTCEHKKIWQTLVQQPLCFAMVGLIWSSRNLGSSWVWVSVACLPQSLWLKPESFRIDCPAVKNLMRWDLFYKVLCYFLTFFHLCTACAEVVHFPALLYSSYNRSMSYVLVSEAKLHPGWP